MISVSVQAQDFDAGAELAAVRANNARVGAVACFIGTVRDLGGAAAIDSMTLEHYPGMTERSLQTICEQAAQRWTLEGIRVIHRIGELRAMDQIVLVAVAGKHRGEVFQACEFIMDYLKTQAPFWKKESGAAGSHWVDARDADDAAARRWQTDRQSIGMASLQKRRGVGDGNGPDDGSGAGSGRDQ